jgi:hypothetical protein
MKKDYLNEDKKYEKRKIKKLLFGISCHLERIRLYLDDYIYPRDHALNILDIGIDLNA